MGSVCVAALLAWAGWLAPSLLGVGPAELRSAAVTGALTGLVLGAILVPVAGLVWMYWRAPWRTIEDLHQRIAMLEESRAGLPSPGLRFEYDQRLGRAKLHVTNQGGAAEFFAPMTIDGALSTPVDIGVFAAWEHTAAVRVRLARGETRTLHLASLDVASFPFAQWKIQVAAEGRGAWEVSALHTSVVGGLPDTQAPRLLLHVSLASTPDAADGAAQRVVALDPFGAAVLTA